MKAAILSFLIIAESTKKYVPQGELSMEMSEWMNERTHVLMQWIIMNLLIFFCSMDPASFRQKT